MKISEESSAASSCSVTGSCTSSQDRLAAGGGAGSPVVPSCVRSMILALWHVPRWQDAPFSGCSGCASCSELFHSCSALHRAAEAQPGGEHRLRRVQRKPISPCPHQPPRTDRMIFLPLGFPRSRRGCLRRARERQEPAPRCRSAGAIPAMRRVRM